MLFLFKEKPIEITAFVPDIFASVNEHSPIRPSKEFFPKWWRDVASSHFDWDVFEKRTTIKSCPGVISTLSSGFIVPMWSDLAIEYSKDHWKYSYSDQKSLLTHHANGQMPGFYEDHWIFKLQCPWNIRSSVNLLYTQPFYLHNTPFPLIQPYGISVPISELNACNVFLFAKKDDDLNRVMIKHGTPLVHILPLTDRPVKFKTEVVSQDEYNRNLSIQSGSVSFTSRALKLLFKSKHKK